jgi:hypothetical protein
MQGLMMYIPLITADVGTTSATFTYQRDPAKPACVLFASMRGGYGGGYEIKNRPQGSKTIDGLYHLLTSECACLQMSTLHSLSTNKWWMSVQWW